MTRDEAISLYQPLRAAAKDITTMAMKDVYRLDMQRAAKQLGLWSGSRIRMPAEGVAIEMLMDVAMFEANQHGVRPFDRFLDKRSATLSDHQRDLAERMAKGRFSLFHVSGKHPCGGLELIDVLYGDQALWLMDRTIDHAMPMDVVIGMRVFDAGPFHMGFGMAMTPDEETIQMSVAVMQREGRTPFRYPLSATLYADAIAADPWTAEREADVEGTLMDMRAVLPPSNAGRKRGPKR